MIVHDCAQGTPEWMALRCGRPTASEFSRIVTSKGEESKQRIGYARTLAAEVYAGAQMADGWAGNAWTERGKEIEAEALARYEFQNDTPITKVGFVTLDDGVAGASPDGLVGDDGLIEVKCLKAENHVEVILFHRRNGFVPADYIVQTQGQMFVTGRQWCDSVFYHPQLPLLIVRTLPNKAVTDGLVSGIPALIKERDAIVATLRSV